MSVLVVDDEPANVDLLVRLLHDEGLQRITTETDSRRVPALLPSVNPDLVLLDLNMPYVDGHAILESIIKFAGGIYLPVLVLTADASPAARNRALAYGARDFLTKPLDLTEVTLRVANLLETRHLYAARRHTANPREGVRHLDTTALGRVERVLNEESITPVFQRIVDISDMSTVGYEALARFPQSHERGPAGWFDDAFQVGLGVELEQLAVSRSLDSFSRFPSGSFLALNMSAATILRVQEQNLCNPALYPQIVIELTEHVPIEDYSAVHKSLSGMRELGTRLAADDLGAGYAGFRHLIALAPDIIKLDISIISGIHRSRGAHALVSALVAFAVNMGAIVIAEGVEEASELAALKAIGVHLAQGYFLGYPELVPE